MAAPQTTDIQEGQLLWTPSLQRREQTSLHAYMQWLANERGQDFADYHALWQWSTDDLDGFWQSIWDYFQVKSITPSGTVLAERKMPGAKWFPGARLNFAEHILRREQADANALYFMSETTPLQGLPWPEFSSKVRTLATALREMGVKPGDRVVAYLPNIPEAMIAMLASTAIGAVWSSCSPDFGSRGVLDRIQQLSPKVLFAIDGYHYGGKLFDRREELANIVTQLPSLQQLIYLPGEFSAANPRLPTFSRTWDEVLDRPAVSAEEFYFAYLPFDHPLWILFSSGTTGLPKAIVHGHGGILLEQLKCLHFHMDCRPGDKAFFYTTTGWMMWNVLSSFQLSGACPVLYDGNPAYPGPDTLWQIVQDSGSSLMGASPSYVEIMKKQGIVPAERFELSKLRTIMLAGSPVSPECSAWFYQNVKEDLWIATGSGGTDVCSGFVGGVPIQPVYAGEIQAPSLGVAAKAFNDNGESIFDEVGELVITQPMPSMPVGFWNDPDNDRYRESYFDTYPGVWRHGDFFRINQRHGCFVLGRSDATLNRYGVRIGTAEVYRALGEMDEVQDALILNLDLPGGRFFMPLFVKLSDGMELDETLEEKIRTILKTTYTPRHVPDKIYQVEDIPMTLTGKKMEVPVRRILSGTPLEKAVNTSAMRNPQALNFFIHYAAQQNDYSL